MITCQARLTARQHYQLYKCQNRRLNCILLKTPYLHSLLTNEYYCNWRLPGISPIQLFAFEAKLTYLRIIKDTTHGTQCSEIHQAYAGKGYEKNST